MPLFGVNMAIPVKEHHRQSQIYILSSSESVPPENDEKKYRIFKALETVFAICSLFLYVFSVHKNSMRTKLVEDMLICAILGALVIYPILFIIFALNLQRKPIIMTTINISTFVILLAVGGKTVSTCWIKLPSTEINYHEASYVFEERNAIKLTSSIMCIVNGFFYFIESLVMFLELRGYI